MKEVDEDAELYHDHGHVDMEAIRDKYSHLHTMYRFDPAPLQGALVDLESRKPSFPQVREMIDARLTAAVQAAIEEVRGACNSRDRERQPCSVCAARATLPLTHTPAMLAGPEEPEVTERTRRPAPAAGRGGVRQRRVGSAAGGGREQRGRQQDGRGTASRGTQKRAGQGRPDVGHPARPREVDVRAPAAETPALSPQQCDGPRRAVGYVCAAGCLRTACSPALCLCLPVSPVSARPCFIALCLTHMRAVCRFEAKLREEKLAARLQVELDWVSGLVQPLVEQLDAQAGRVQAAENQARAVAAALAEHEKAMAGELAADRSRLAVLERDFGTLDKRVKVSAALFFKHTSS